MNRGFFTLVFRRLRSEMLYTIIKIVGLATALASAFLIYLYTADELRFDRHNEAAETLYRVIQIPREGTDLEPAAITPFPLHNLLQEQYPHVIESSARLFNNRLPRVSMRYADGEKQFYERRFFFADSTLFNIFDVTFIQGDAATALSRPDALVMTRETARRYFGDDDPIGKVVRFDGRFDLTVTAVIEHLPETSHVQWDVLASMESLSGLFQGGIPETWDWSIVWTYVRAAQGVSQSELDEALAQLSVDVEDRIRSSPSWFISQPVIDIRLHSDLYAEIGPVSSMAYIKILAWIAGFILTIAVINFVNMSLATSASRTVEVGMRKVLGAGRTQIFRQYMSEALVTGLLALAGAILLLVALMPWFGEITGRDATLSVLKSVHFWVFAAGISVLSASVAGLYPSLVLSGWSPLKLFRENRNSESSGAWLSRGLILIQFSVAAFLIAGTWVVFNQLDFMRNERLGFDHEQTVVIPAGLTRMIFFWDAYRDQARQHPQVRQVIGTNVIFGIENQTFGYLIDGRVDEGEVTVPLYFVTEGFEEVFGLELVAGRTFSSDFINDATESVIVNERFVQQMGYGNPLEAIGRSLQRDSFRFNIIGVVRDFNFASLHTEIEPLVFEMPKNIPAQIGYVMARLEPGNPEAALGALEAAWKEVDPNRPFEYFWLDEQIQQQYENEQQLAGVSGFFALIAIALSCFGLFGLASYTTLRKRKSVGIRKVLGASTGQLVMLLSREFILLVIAANLLALPAVIWIMGSWLEGFAYRTEIGPVILISTFLLTILIAFSSVSWQTIRAASQNPVDSIRHE